jgi:acetyltransferase-like isoleucine patch superfamily enzyme
MTNQAYTHEFSRIGEDVTIWPLAKIVSPETIAIGDSVIIDDFVFLMGGQKTTMGSFIHIASFASLAGGGELILEDFAGISSGTRVYTGNDDYVGGSLTGPTVPFPFRVPIRSFVHIRKHAIIGANSVILPGVTIGEGASIGALSFVSRDCEPWTIYAGCPAKPLRARPRERVLELEQRLREELYTRDGIYIPKNARQKIAGE